MPQPDSRKPFRILCVCTGNICRSPAAERLLAVALGPSVSVISAGTHALQGQPISPPMDSFVEEAGGSAEAFSARQLNESLIRPVELVLTMTRAHRSAVVQIWPASVRHAFTLRQFAGLLSLIDPAELPAGTVPDRLRSAIPLAASRRGRLISKAEEDDVPDPYRRGDQVYALAFAEIKAAVDAISRTIRPSVD